MEVSIKKWDVLDDEKRVAKAVWKITFATINLMRVVVTMCVHANLTTTPGTSYEMIAQNDQFTHLSVPSVF